MLIIFVRTIILYILVVVVLRIMGKRQVGQLQPFELVVAIMLSELAAVPMQDKGIPLVNGIVPIITLLFVQIIFSYVTYKSEKARKLICGTPTIVIRNGKIEEEELARLQYSIDDLLEQLRSKDSPNIGDIEFAVLETNGQLSIVPKSQKRPLTPSDLNIPTNYEGLPVNLIINSKLEHENLKKLNLTEEWLISELKKSKIDSVSEVLFCCIDTSGKIILQRHRDKEE